MPPPFFGGNGKKKEDCNFTFENTDLITQRNNSPFDFTKYVVRANFYTSQVRFNPCNARKAQMEDNLTHIFPELNKTIKDVYIF